MTKFDSAARTVTRYNWHPNNQNQVGKPAVDKLGRNHDWSGLISRVFSSDSRFDSCLSHPSTPYSRTLC